MSEIKKVAEAVLLAAQLKKASYTATGLTSLSHLGYKKSTLQCCEEAVGRLKLSAEYSYLLLLAFHSSWDDIIAWAEAIRDRGEASLEGLGLWNEH